jgi:quercetin dioxygenase-like cupin family protein
MKTNHEVRTIIGPETYFYGKAWIEIIIDEHNAGCSIANVTFEPGAHTHWHTHPSTQILIALRGTGIVQVKGRQPMLLSPGDSCIIDPMIEHWHGASVNSLFTHQAVQLVDDKITIIRPVTDKEYSSMRL